MLLGAQGAAGDGRAVGRADHEPPGEGHEVLAGLPFEFFPKLVGPQQERHVIGALEVRLTDDPGLAVAGALVVRRGVPLQPEDLLAASRQLAGGGTPHPPEADHDDVVADTVGRQAPSSSTPGSV